MRNVGEKKTSGSFDGTELNHMLCLYCKDAQVAGGGSHGAFLSITQCSLIRAAFRGCGQVDIIFMIRSDSDCTNITFTVVRTNLSNL